jgi:hypothetical protein
LNSAGVREPSGDGPTGDNSIAGSRRKLTMPVTPLPDLQWRILAQRRPTDPSETGRRMVRVAAETDLEEKLADGTRRVKGTGTITA